MNKRDSSEENASRLRPTALDGLIAGLSPLLIIGMICSLVFFLVIIVYQGNYQQRLMYILGLYTLAIVLVARIAIEQSRSLAFGYTALLGTATLFVTLRFVSFQGILAPFSLPIVAGFLILIGWLADRITFDCTLIDEQKEESGVGLLQSLGFLANPRNAVGPNAHKESAKRLTRPPSPPLPLPEADKSPFIGNAARGDGLRTGSKNLDPSRQISKAKKHNPGIWVLYFAWMAIPLFGLGQLMIPGEDDSSRRLAFLFLFGYLFFALSLLAITAFLSMRRYLRKRDTPMPSALSIAWIGGGIAGALTLLVLVSLLPLPSGSYGLFDFPLQIESRTNVQPSRYGWGNNGVETESDQARKQINENSKSDQKLEGDGESKTAGASEQGKAQSESGGKEESQKGKSDQSTGSQESQSPKGKDSSKQKNSDGKTGKTSSQNSSSPHPPREPTSPPQREGAKRDDAGNDSPSQKEQKPSSTKKQSSEKNESSPAKNTSEKNAGNETTQSQERSERKESSQNQKQSAEAPPPAQPKTIWSVSLAGGLANLFRWIVILILMVMMAYWLIRYRHRFATILAELAAWWQGLFGLPPLERFDPAGSESLVPEERMISFRELVDPFTGRLKMNSARIIQHTFHAVEVWGREHKVVRIQRETPQEYLQRIMQTYPEQRERLQVLAQLYNQIAYAAGQASQPDIRPLRELWAWLSRTAAAVFISLFSGTLIAEESSSPQLRFPTQKSEADSAKNLPSSVTKPPKFDIQTRSPRPIQELGWPAGYTAVQSAHFRIATQGSTQLAIEVAKLCEQTYTVWLQLFPEAWADPKKSADPIRSNEYSPLPQGERRFQIVLFRDRESYLRQLSHVESNVAVSTGYYSPQARMVFCYWDATTSVPTLRHELTHQFFAEGSRWADENFSMRSSDFWLVEGLALFMESVQIVGSNGRQDAVLGGWDARRLQPARYRRLHDTTWVPWNEFRKADSTRFHDGEEIKIWYSQAAGLAHLWMESTIERHENFIDYVESYYRGEPDPKLLGDWNDDDALRTAYDRFLATPPKSGWFPTNENVTDVVLSRCDLDSNALLKWPTKNRKLDWLDLSFTSVDDSLFNEEDGRWDARRLNLESTKVGDASLMKLAKMPSLEELDLSNCSITDDGLAAMKGNRTLKILWLTGNSTISDRSIETLATMTKLEQVDIQGTSITDAAWQQILRKSPKLRKKK
jgi:hypothetical protein